MPILFHPLWQIPTAVYDNFIIHLFLLNIYDVWQSGVSILTHAAPAHSSLVYLAHSEYIVFSMSHASLPYPYLHS